ncbi:uncharacterized protein N7515_003820 [Penicillium bovifimosum]|uniref:RRM domain-containing protein n=1 Tax=Penicillium bovifimosum TaxID=126998 RepID=A0A9W9L6L0_9EURO|nr:uncharacterized protein N7515_003820 [Penicillium bovifimosum]KAJ5138972.1 hypothetical protein N7515_003820 [Penicillium bovifimosum]
MAPYGTRSRTDLSPARVPSEVLDDYEVTPKYDMYGLEKIDTPVVFRKVAPAIRASANDNDTKMQIDIMTVVLAQTGGEASSAAETTTLTSSTGSCASSKENKQNVVATDVVHANEKSTTTFTGKKSGIDPRAKPFFPRAGSGGLVLGNRLRSATVKITKPNGEELILPPRRYASAGAEPVAPTVDLLISPSSKAAAAPKESLAAATAELEDSDFDWDDKPGNQPAKEAESSNNKESAPADKPVRGLTSPKDFMKQVRLIHEMKLQASKAAAVGRPRRIIFGNIPDWATKADILQLVHGGAVENAWNGDGEVTVQFVNQEACIAYYEAHGGGITLGNADEELTISVTMPEDGQPDHPELRERASKGGSRVVCLSGLRPGLKGSNGEDILGIVSAPTWEGKEFDHVVIRPGTLGLDVYVFFYDLHVGWDFLHSIQDGDYECAARFEADPCTLDSFHFVDEPNRMFTVYDAGVGAN